MQQRFKAPHMHFPAASSCTHVGSPLPPAAGHRIPQQPWPPLILMCAPCCAGSGLSSSAAFVCACSLAVLGARGISMGKAEVAEFAAKAER